MKSVEPADHPDCHLSWTSEVIRSVYESESWADSKGALRNLGGTLESLGAVHKIAGRRSDTSPTAPSTEGETASGVCDPVA